MLMGVDSLHRYNKSFNHCCMMQFYICTFVGELQLHFHDVGFLPS